MTFNDTGPKIAILLCTYNGDRFIAEQLDSIYSQTHRNLEIWVSDDNSNDQTINILERFQKKWGSDRLIITQGPKIGSAENFMHITCNANITADFYAYADQDDIWEKDKIEKALEALQTFKETPSLYGSRTKTVDEYGNFIGLSPLFIKPPSFKNALVQSISGGNTMVFNHKAMQLIRSAGEVKIIGHDWWIYMLIAGAGGKIIYDPTPTLLYRQHNTNVMGTNQGPRAKLQRMYIILNGGYRIWIQVNIDALSHSQALLTKENLVTFEKFKKIHTGGFFNRITSFFSSEIYRQSSIDNFSLFIAALLNKL